MRNVSSRLRSPRKLHSRSGLGCAAARRSSSARSGPSPTTTSLAAGTRAIASIATPRAFWRVSRPTKTKVPGSRSLRLDLSRRRRRVREHENTSVGQAPPAGDLGKIRARDDDRRGRPQRSRPRRLERPHRRGRGSWNSSSVPVNRRYRRARSYAGSETSLATSGRRAAARRPRQPRTSPWRRRRQPPGPPARREAPPGRTGSETAAGARRLRPRRDARPARRRPW